MAYIGKVVLSNDWKKIEDLIQSQVEGQSGFSFDSSKQYSIQVDGVSAPFGARVCSSATKPADMEDGEFLTDSQFGVYTPESGASLWGRVKGGTDKVKLSVSEN